ncbi:MAG: L-2,4-diaminobutyrate decarboxylase [Candidatus Paceibacteria bacterium]|jgi:L-2,4-diaminobutyrate decarboxylase
MRPYAPYDAEDFRSIGHSFVDRLADYLARCSQALPGDPNSPPVLALREPKELEALWAANFEDGPAADKEQRALEFVDSVLEACNHLHQPGYIGHQVSPSLPFATLLEMLSSLLNNGMAVWEMGQLQTVLERRCVRWMADKIGFPKGAGGLMTSGGSLGNLTALLAARQAKTGSWAAGSVNSKPLAVLVSEDSHYCIARAMQIMGQGEQGVIRVPVDENHRMRTEHLEPLLRSAKDRGVQVFAVVSSSCSTSTGAFDDLVAIADFCERHALWLHVDGAHGASQLLSKQYRAPLEGIERADSVVWDAHKMMLVPALSTGLIFREDRHAAETFAQEAAYLFEDDMAAFDIGHRTLECTKRAMGLTLYACLHVYGEALFADYVDRAVGLAREFAGRLEASADFSLPLLPESNIVCFRFTPKGHEPSQLDALQEDLRRKVIQAGRYYLVQTQLPEGTHLRVTLMNPATSIEDLDGLLTHLRELWQVGHSPV